MALFLSFCLSGSNWLTIPSCRVSPRGPHDERYLIGQELWFGGGAKVSKVVPNRTSHEWLKRGFIESATLGRLPWCLPPRISIRQERCLLCQLGQTWS
jgi:hypothetical protein